MKLKNKKTGEIRDFIINKDKIQTASAIDCWEYNSIAELNEEWTDEPEEPKEYWFIDTSTTELVRKILNTPLSEIDKQIGNYFETEEEAERAVKKLKAWKRLKDKGFRFDNCKIEMSKIVVPEITITAFVDTEEPETLNLVNMLFGGEE